MEGGLGAGAGVLISGLPHPYSGYQTTGIETLGVRQLPEPTGTSLGTGARLSWVSMKWGVGWARSPPEFGGGCR